MPYFGSLFLAGLIYYWGGGEALTEASPDICEKVDCLKRNNEMNSELLFISDNTLNRSSWSGIQWNEYCKVIPWISSLNSRDRPEHDSAGAPALLSGRSFCRSRSKQIPKILLLPEAQKLLPKQELLAEQKHILSLLACFLYKSTILWLNIVPKLVNL